MILIAFVSTVAASYQENVVLKPLVFLDWDMTLVHTPRTETGRHRDSMTDAHLATLMAYFEKWNSVNFIITGGAIPTDSPIPQHFIPSAHMFSTLVDQNTLAFNTRDLTNKDEIRR